MSRIFTDRVQDITMGVMLEERPKGLPKTISIEQYNQLPDETKRFFAEDYKRYRTKKIRDYSYCDECGTEKFLGWVETKVPVGKPYQYKATRPLNEQIMDRLNSSNVLMARMLGEQLYGDEQRSD